MARISTYAQDTTITGQDSLIGTDGNNQNSTKIFPVDALGAYLDENFQNDVGSLVSVDRVPVVDSNGNVVPSNLGSTAIAITDPSFNGYTFHLRRIAGRIELESSNYPITTIGIYDITSFDGRMFTADFNGDPLLPRSTKTIGDYLGIRRDGEDEFLRLETNIGVAALAVELPNEGDSIDITNFLLAEGSVLIRRSIDVGTGGGGGDGTLAYDPRDGGANGVITTFTGGSFDVNTGTLSLRQNAIVVTPTTPVVLEEAVANTLYSFYRAPGEAVVERTLFLPNDPEEGDTVRISNLWGSAGIIVDRTNPVHGIQGLLENLELDDFRASFELTWTGADLPGWVIVGGSGGDSN